MFSIHKVNDYRAKLTAKGAPIDEVKLASMFQLAYAIQSRIKACIKFSLLLEYMYILLN